MTFQFLSNMSINFISKLSRADRRPAEKVIGYLFEKSHTLFTLSTIIYTTLSSAHSILKSTLTEALDSTTYRSLDH